MILPFEWMIAWRYMRARKERFVSLITLFSILGITLGVATLILVTSLMNGIRTEMSRLFVGIDGPVAIYGVQENYQPLMQHVQAMPDVKAVVPRVMGQVMLVSQGNAQGAQVIAMPLADLLLRDLITSHVTSGDITSIEQRQGVVLGERLAANMRLQVGDDVQLISPRGRATVAGMVPRMKSYPLVATVKTGMHMYDSSLVIMPFSAAQTYFQLGEGVTMLEVDVDDIDNASEIAQSLQQEIGDSVVVYDWQHSNQSVFAALTIQRNVMVLILALIVLVAAFNIISSLIMLVKDKGRDIAVLRTLGATPAHIMHIFVLSGSLVGVVGTGLGVGLGMLAAFNLEAIKNGMEMLTGQQILVGEIYFLSSLPTRVEWHEVLLIAVLSCVLAVVATLYPARRASRIHPAEALRYE